MCKSADPIVTSYPGEKMVTLLTKLILNEKGMLIDVGTEDGRLQLKVCVPVSVLMCQDAYHT